MENPSGFTIDITIFETPKEGIVVSYEATQNSFGKEGLRKAIQHARSHAHIVGGWLNCNDKQCYFDSDTIFQENMLDETIKWAKKNNQSAIYVLSEKKEITVQRDSYMTFLHVHTDCIRLKKYELYP